MRSLQNMGKSVPQTLSYMICTSPRSGSTLLCKFLKATGIAGAPESYFHGPSLDAWANNLGIAPKTPQRDLIPKIFEAAITKGRGSTDVFAVRQQYHSFPLLCQTLSAYLPQARSDYARLSKVFGPLKIIHLTRQDKLGQAVSLIRAEQTGLWHVAPDGTDIERKSPTRAGGYDAALIAEHIETLTQYDQEWLRWFAAQQITPLRVSYEALSDDPVAQVQRILSWLGLDPQAVTHVRVPVKKLADATNATWIAAYKRDRWSATQRNDDFERQR